MSAAIKLLGAVVAGLAIASAVGVAARADDPIDAKSVERVLSRIYATPPELVERVKAIISAR